LLYSYFKIFTFKLKFKIRGVAFDIDCMSKLKFYILTFMLASLLGRLPFAWADSYSDGVAAYNNKNYTKAFQLFSATVKQNPNNADAVFYMGLSCAHQNQLNAAREAFEMVIQMVPPNSALADKARTNISFLTKQQITQASSSAKASQVITASLSKGSKDNYLTHVITGGKVVHFALNRMPLKVYIADGLGIPGWDGHLKQAVLSAMRAWQTASRGKISFSQTWTESNADIVVRWQKNFADNILGVSPFQTVGNTIVRSDINLAVSYPSSNVPIPFGELTTIAAHEMGHAIGLKGHSPYPGDVMYYSSDHASNQPLSQRDINTIGLLYQLDADIQNNSGASTAQTKNYYQLYDQGFKAQSDRRATDAINYYRQAIAINNTLPEAKFNLGALLINEGNKMVRANNLEGAQRNFAEATRLYTEVLHGPQPPPSARENLDIARTNLNLVTSVLHQK
jgi:tetratricopeptide (TPR) repeat protein